MAKQTKKQAKGAPVQSWEARYYGQLVGRTITAVTIQGDGSARNPMPVLTLDNGLRVYVQCDAEGNGPGFLYGLPTPTTEATP